MRLSLLPAALIGIATLACAPARPTLVPSPVPARQVTILHFNDVYEITPVEGGKSGGLARVATIRERLLKNSTPLLTLLGGDYYSPSAMGLAQIDGTRLAGRQMVEILNAVGLDWAVLGNHEFDIREAEFRARLGESRFGHITGNVTDSAGRPFPNTVPRAIVTLPTPGGAVRIGLVGVTIDDNRQPWVRYADPIAALRRDISALRDSVDLLVALTHQTLSQDQRVVELFPELDLLVGGHEHENYLLRRGPRFTPIVKADANVRTVALITLDPDASPAVTDVRFVAVDASIPEQPAVAAQVQRWVDRVFAAYVAEGLNPTATVATIPEALDGREATVRVREGNLTALIAAALRREVPDAEVGLMNGGSIRIDDVLSPGAVTQYDVIRVLPFGGLVSRTTMTGELLGRVLTQGVANRGSGGFLHADGAIRTDDGWIVAGEPIRGDRVYVVATTDFLLTGRERGLDYLAPGTPGLGAITEFRDIRRAVIDEMARRWP
jgi:5'-nucleotidase / UDP-sugar diphosphatase